MVTGNHDCYGKNHIYGVSPRVLGVIKGNEGIPADHNLTFYEAMLVFGETWSKVFGTLFNAKLYEWFYAVFTPFADFSLELPKLRILGLAWGEKEEVLSSPGSGGQTYKHLGRAAEAVTAGQIALLSGGLSSDKKTALMTHFTLVSYDDSIPVLDGPVSGHIDVGGPGLSRIFGKPFSDHDFGTFQDGRAALYGSVADSGGIACVVTGHSHRKGMYLLGANDGKGYATEAFGLRSSAGNMDPASHAIGRAHV